MSMKFISGLELRGNIYYLRVRVPKAYADVEPKTEINRSLKTKDLEEAQAKCLTAKMALKHQWDALRAGRTADQRALFRASTELLKGWGLTFSPLDDLVKGPIDDLVSRLEKLSANDAGSFAVPALLGAIDLPDCSLDEMARRMPVLMEADILAKNARQKREWSSNFVRAAKNFAEQIGTRTILTISEQDAIDYEDFWKRRHRTGEVSANYANKQIRYVRQMIDAHYEDIRLPRSKRKNPFLGMKVSKAAFDTVGQDRRKLPLPEPWIRDRLIGDRILEDCCPEASDIAIVSAECGTRGTEVYDIPAEDIHLDHEIPHFQIRVITDGPDRRQIKNLPSTRTVVLLGASLEAMKRNSLGFVKNRGKARFSSSVNAYLRNNDLFPDLPQGARKNYTISCTRHSYEDRMIAAGMSNEERAYLMGHSIGNLRGRPVYGSDIDLRIKALLQEMVAFPTATWTPRPISALREEIDVVLKKKGHRTE